MENAVKVKKVKLVRNVSDFYFMITFIVIPMVTPSPKVLIAKFETCCEAHTNILCLCNTKVHFMVYIMKCDFVPTAYGHLFC